MKYQAIVLAAGDSTRANLSYNKVLHKIGDNSIIFYSAQNFLLDKDCEKLYLVCKEVDISLLKEIFINYEKVDYVIGGKTRQESVKNALEKVNSEYVIIHDGARPYFTVKLLENLKEKLNEYNGVIPVISSTDTLKIVKDNIVIKTIKRDEVKRVQTPQGFKTSVLLHAHNKALNNNYTDDSSIIEELTEEKIYVIDGEVNNIKYTNKEDF